MTEVEYRYTDVSPTELSLEVSVDDNPYDIHFVYWVGEQCHVIIGCSTRPLNLFIGQMCNAGLTQAKLYDIYHDIPNEVHIARASR